MKRRDLMKKTLTTLGAASTAAFSIRGIQASSGSCKPIATQPEGPFYPIADQFDKDNDLTKVQGKLVSAKGEVVVLQGIVLDEACKPVKGALVEIWQACETGKYNHPGDPNTAVLDPNFQYWGRAVTNEKGEYSFKTIKPGAYRANATWVRPPHIHLKVHLRGFEELTTQVYFAGESLNQTDRILQSLSKSDISDVTVSFKKENAKHPTGNFNITLTGLQS